MRRLSLVLFFIMALFLTAVSAQAAPKFKIKEFNDFHDVLHPLEHESMPKQDYESIRNKADELVRLGNAIVQLGAPRGMSHTQVQAYETELNNFSDALKRLAEAAKGAKDTDVKHTFSAVHDSFEMLAGMLPRD